MTYSDILRDIKTIDQARELGSEIDTLLNNLFKTKKGFEDILSLITAVGSQKIKDSLLNNKIDMSNQTATKDFLESLKHEIQKLKEINLTLAFEPNQSTIDNLFTWISQNLGDGIVLQINVDKSILGGAIIEYKGKYEDLTLRKKLEEVFGSKRGEITHTLNS
jgi:F0F1-type ATP synthase delta subunit